jgi:hypothetical protein
LKPGSNYAPTKPKVKNMSAKTVVGYSLKSDAITTTTRSRKIVVVADEAGASGAQSVSGGEYYLTSRTSFLKAGNGYAPTKPKVRNMSAKSGVDFNVRPVASAFDTAAKGDLDTVSQVAPPISVLPPTPEKEYSLTSRTSFLKPGSNYAPTKPKVKNMSAKSVVGYSLKSTAITTATRSSNIVVVADEAGASGAPSVAGIEYYLTSRTSFLKAGNSYAPTKPKVRNMSAKSGVDFHVRPVTSAFDTATKGDLVPISLDESPSVPDGA